MTSQFPDKIGRKNGVALPYPLLIEGDRAYILDPILHIHQPIQIWKMEQFMAIGTIPEQSWRSLNLIK